MGRSRGLVRGHMGTLLNWTWLPFWSNPPAVALSWKYNNNTTTLSSSAQRPLELNWGNPQNRNEWYRSEVREQTRMFLQNVRHSFAYTLGQFDWKRSIESVRLKAFDCKHSIESVGLRAFDWKRSIESVQWKAFEYDRKHSSISTVKWPKWMLSNYNSAPFFPIFLALCA